MLTNGQVLTRLYATTKPEDVSALIADIASETSTPSFQARLQALGGNGPVINASTIRLSLIQTVTNDHGTADVERFAAISALLPVNGDVNEAAELSAQQG